MYVHDLHFLLYHNHFNIIRADNILMFSSITTYGISLNGIHYDASPFTVLSILVPSVPPQVLALRREEVLSLSCEVSLLGGLKEMQQIWKLVTLGLEP